MSDRNTPRRVRAGSAPGQPPSRQSLRLLLGLGVVAFLVALVCALVLLDGAVSSGPGWTAPPSEQARRSGHAPPPPAPEASEGAAPAPAAPAAASQGAAPPPRRQRGRHEALPLTSAGRVDFAALGMTGKESGAELLRAEEPRQPAQVRYAFEVGESWEVRTYYRQMQAGEGDVWSDAVRWRYTVEREDAFRGQRVRVLVVRMLDAQGRVDARFPATTFYVARDSQRLVGADLYEVRAGKGKYKTVAYEGQQGPQRASGSIVPFDLPPNGIEGERRLGKHLRHLEPATEASRARFPQPAELVGHGQESIACSYRLPEGGTVRQRWAPRDMRWPVESVGPHSRSYRLK